MLRPKRSVLESRNAEITENARDLEKNTKFKAPEATSSKNKRRINDDKPIFQLVLPPDLVKDLENSSDNILLSSNLIRSTKFDPVKDSIRQPTIEILSSSGEDDIEAGCSHSSVESNKKSLLEEMEETYSLVNSRNLPQEHNLSTSKRHESKLLSMKQESIQSPKKQIEMSSDDNDSDPFGFNKAEKRIRKKRNVQSQSSSDNLQKFEVTTIDKDSQYNDNVQSEITKSISLNKEKNRNDTDGISNFFEVDKQDQTQRKRENEESTSSNENDKSHPTHEEGHLGHLSTENDKNSAESSRLSPMKTPRNKNKKVEKKNTTPSRTKKTPNITKTADLISLLPRRRQLEHVY